MIWEIATLSVDPKQAPEFEAAVAEARPLFLAAEGCVDMRLERVIEDPGSYRLVVQWETVEHHTEIFRNSEGFARWRGLAGPYFVTPPSVVHTAKAVG